MKKEKTIRTYQRRTKTGKVVTVKQHTAKYDAAEALKEAAKKKGAGDELEALKKKKPVAQKEEVKSPYEEYGFTKDEFKEWYEGTGSKADKKVEKALKKAMGAKAYNALSDRAADEYKKGGAHRFFTKGLEEMKASTSASTKSVTPTKETKASKDESLKVGSSIQMGNSLNSGKGKKETFKVLAVQKTNKQDRELGNTEAAWVQRKDGSVTLALKDSEKGWMYDDTWTDFTDRKHPYAKSLEAAGYSFKKAQGKGGKYWEVSKEDGSKSKDSKEKIKEAHASLKEKGYKRYTYNGKVYYATKSGSLKQVDSDGRVHNVSPFVGAKGTQEGALIGWKRRDAEKAKAKRDKEDAKKYRESLKSKSTSKEPEDLGSPKGQRFEYKYGKYIITKEGQVFTSTGKKVSKKMTSNILAARENAKKMFSRGKKKESAASDDTAAFKAFLKLPKPAKGSKGYAAHMALRSAARWGGASDDTLRDALVRNGYPSKDAYSKGIKEVIALAKKHKITL